MNKIPEALLQSLEGVAGFEAEGFLKVHERGGGPVSIRMNPAKPFFDPADFQQVPWCPQAFYIQKQEPFPLDPLWHAGAYYVQEASSMILQQVFEQVIRPQFETLRILDLCAAPGGKSTHLLSMLNDEDVLVSNEVIQSRATILVENITRWGNANVIVTNNDPEQIGRLEGFFDAMVVDAPCSGSGLFRKDNQAIEEWSENAVALCSQRQQRILADVWPALKQDGILVYATCSYSPAEDEEIVDFISTQLGAEAIQLDLPSQWGIVTSASPITGSPCYRFFPDKVEGEGFFLAVFRKTASTGDDYSSVKVAGKPKLPDPSAIDLFVDPVKPLEWHFQNDNWYAMPANTFACFNAVQKKLRVRKAGVCIGQIMHGKLIPDHALALSHILHPQVHAAELDIEAARNYLRKTDFMVENAAKGWTLARYQGAGLGWFKNLGNRINNYYPTEWRLRL